MKKQLLFFCLLSLLWMALLICTHAQSKRLFEASKEYVTKDVTVTDGMTYKYSIGKPEDTIAHYFNPGTDVYEVSILFKKAGGTTPPVIITEKVDGEKATFSPNWSLHGPTTAPGWFGPSIAYSNVVGSSVSYTFTGTKIELWAERKLTHGKGVVNLNGVDTPVTFVGVSALPVLIYSSPDLPLGTYTIKLSVVSGFSLLDYFIVHK